jgi:hypothetical protein
MACRRSARRQLRVPSISDAVCGQFIHTLKEQLLWVRMFIGHCVQQLVGALLPIGIWKYAVLQ